MKNVCLTLVVLACFGIFATGCKKSEEPSQQSSVASPETTTPTQPPAGEQGSGPVTQGKEDVPAPLKDANAPGNETAAGEK